MTFHLMYAHIILSSVLVAEWLPFGKELLTRVWVLTASVSALCILFTFLYRGIWFLGHNCRFVVANPTHVT